MWCSDLYDVKPDIVTIGKAWGGGFPFGAVIAYADLITPEIEATPGTSSRSRTSRCRRPRRWR